MRRVREACVERGRCEALATGNPKLRRVVGCQYTDQDLSELERCNRDNIDALRDIVGGVGSSTVSNNSGDGGGGRMTSPASDTATSLDLKVKVRQRMSAPLSPTPISTLNPKP